MKRADKASRKVVVTSVPKCGTHLLLSLLYRMGFQRFDPEDIHYRKAVFKSLAEGVPLAEVSEQAAVVQAREQMLQKIDAMPDDSVVAHHFPFDQILADAFSARGMPVLFMIRDPRAQVVSYRTHVLRDPHNKHLRRFESVPENVVYRWLLDGAAAEESPSDAVTGVVTLYRRFDGWLAHDGTEVIAFNHLVGPKGGGSRVRQLAELEKILFNLHSDFREDADENLRLMFSEKHSLFSVGQAEGWRRKLDKENREVFEREVRPRLIDYMAHLEAGFPSEWDAGEAQAELVRRAHLLAERDWVTSSRQLARCRERAELLERHVKKLMKASK